MSVETAKSGRVRAVCCDCGRRTRWHLATERGEVHLWDLPYGWSVAPFRDGDRYRCDVCNLAPR